MSLTSTLRSARSVALVGASEDPSKPAGRVLFYLQQYGYTGSVYPVNPRYEELAGLPCYPSLDQLPERPDIVVVALAGELAEDAVRTAVEQEVGTVILFASGYAEAGTPDGLRLQEQLTAIVTGSTTRLLGPNTNGMVEVAGVLPLTFMSAFEDGIPLHDDRIGLVSQSGAVGGFVLREAQLSGLGVSSFYATGNEVDLTTSELITSLVEDNASVILVYVEGVNDGQAFQDALARARAKNVPVVVLKVGTSGEGAAAAGSHTGAVAGDDVVFDGVLRRYAVPRATSIDHLLDLGRVLALSPHPAGNRVTILTLSGGAGILATDAMASHGLCLASWEGAAKEAMGSVLPPFAALNNPIDLTGNLIRNPELLETALDQALEHDGTDMVLILLGNMQSHEERLCASIAARAEQSAKPVVVVWVGGTGTAPVALGRAGVPAFTDPVKAVAALGGLAEWYGEKGRPSQPDPATADPVVGSDPSPTTVLDEHEAKSLLSSYGVPVPGERLCSSASEALSAVGELTPPYVVKAASPDVLHKTELGLVKVGLDADEVESAAAEILSALEGLGARGGVLVQEFVKPGAELILGMTRDPVFGPVLVVGTGGVLVEVLKDVTARPLPLTEGEALQMIDELRLSALLDGPRGTAAASRPELARAITAFALAVAEHPQWESAEINPLIIHADSGLPVAVDALVVSRILE